MAVLVLECPLDQETLLTIQELRTIRLQVLATQLAELDAVMDRLRVQGALEDADESTYREVIHTDLTAQYRKLESRIALSETVYFDELELYLDILSGR